MKNIIILFLIISHVLFSNAQTLTVTGATTIPSSDPCLQSHASLTVKNISSSILNVLCEKIIIDTAAGTTNFFCWGANCYSSNTYISTSYNTLSPGEGDNIDFGGYYDASCDLAPATIEYCFFPDIDPSDKTCITIVYNGSNTDIIQNARGIVAYEFFPNPAKEYVTINYQSEQKLHLKIIDIFGNNCKDIPLSNIGRQDVYVGGLGRGVYLGYLVSKEGVIDIKKLILE